MPKVYEARLARKQWWQDDPLGFVDALEGEIEALCRLAKRRELKPACRLNATSDILWERKAARLFKDFPDVQFYDYTKHPLRRVLNAPKNYHLTVSWDEQLSRDEQVEALAHTTLAVPFAAAFDAKHWELPETYLNHRVVDGDAHDLTFLRPRGTVIGLRFKGRGGSRPKWNPDMFAVPVSKLERRWGRGRPNVGRTVVL